MIPVSTIEGMKITQLRHLADAFELDRSKAKTKGALIEVLTEAGIVSESAQPLHELVIEPHVYVDIHFDGAQTTVKSGVGIKQPTAGQVAGIRNRVERLELTDDELTNLHAAHHTQDWDTDRAAASRLIDALEGIKRDRLLEAQGRPQR